MNRQILRPPFPPQSLNINEITNESIKKHRAGKSSKTPNAFLLYRKEYTATFKNSNLGHISTLSSEAWNTESIEIKNEYKKLADRINETVRTVIPYYFVGTKEQNSEIPNDDYIINDESNQPNVTYYNPPSSSDVINPNFMYYIF
ncbi:7676_t:CDS:1 [Cetraspora pellucida]|uniref:7676_t:CDS:1 n=1 Tax=Cetraspora pellucida TaxID=1433469 RepID=A0ACA9L3D5_9GLOM|nr:7676_t:CDS:1 [Cetraspora pellucida]